MLKKTLTPALAALLIAGTTLPLYAATGDSSSTTFDNSSTVKMPGASTDSMTDSGAATVKSVDVNLRTYSMKNPAAAQYWAKVSDDLKSAIISRLGGQTSSDGVNLTVAINGADLSNGYMDASGAVSPTLIGTIKEVQPEITGSNGKGNKQLAKTNNVYKLSVSFKQAVAYVPPGTDVASIQPTDKVYYDAMINAFADYVVKHL